MYKGLSILMMIAILVITGFQVFWLRENYRKEKSNLEFRTNVAFRESIRKLQTKKLNLEKLFNDSSGKIKLAVRNAPEMAENVMHYGDGLVDVLNDVTILVKDSMTFIGKNKNRQDIIINSTLKPDSINKHAQRNMVFSMNESMKAGYQDTSRNFVFEKKGPPSELFRFLVNVDSLQDSLRVSVIDSACRAAFDKEGITVPFTVTRNESKEQVRKSEPPDRSQLNKVTIGFSKPITYELQLGNSFGYLVKKLGSPILFSFFLVGVTVLSFVLLFRNLQKQRRLTEIKNEFISNITHELKTPIATVGVAIEALRNFNAINDPQRTKEYLDISQNELHRLSLLVDKVLKLSMFEKKEIELKYEPLDLKDVVDEVISSMRLQIEKHHAAVSLQTDGDTGMQGDKLHLLSVVFNLLDNALKYGNGNIAVKFEIKEMGDQLQLSVADNGIGILPEYKDKVFEKFFRVPSGDKHNTKGYGLGLSYVSHVIQKHKGTIAVESQPGIGTKFIITLPKQLS